MGNEVKNLAYIKAMQTIADRKFGNADKELKADEKEAIKFFEDKMEEAFLAGKINEETFNEAMGLYKSAPAATTEEIEVENKKGETKADKKVKLTKEEKTDIKNKENAVLLYLAEINLDEKLNNRADILKDLERRIKDQNDDAKYIELKKAVADVLALMPEKYNSLKDIERNHDDILKQMDNKGIKDDFHKEVLKKLETFAEKEVRNVAKAQVLKLYNETSKKTEQGTDKTDEQIMDSVKKELEAKKQFKGAVKDAFEAYENGTIMKNARAAVSDAIKQVKNLQKNKDIRQAAKEILINEGKWDKYTDKAMNNKNLEDVAEGRSSYGKDRAEKQAIANRVESSKQQTKKEVLDTLGRSGVLYEVLNSSGLITVDDNKNVDLTALSDLIGPYVGADDTLNRHAAKDKVISERINLQTALSLATELSSLSESEGVKLAKLCGYEIEGKDWRKIILSALAGALAGAGIAAGSAAALPRQKVLVQGDIVNHNLNLNIDGVFNKDALMNGMTQDGVSFTETETGLVINIAQTVIQPDRLIKLSKRLVDFGLAGALPGAALGALEGLKDKGEEAVHPTNIEAKTFEDYVQFITEHLKNAKKAEYTDAFICLAASFIDKDGNWDKKAFLDAVGAQGGFGGVVNAAEAPDACKEKVSTEGAQGAEQTGETEDDILNKIVVERKDKTKENPVEKKLYKEYEVQPGNKWETIVAAFYPGLEAKYGRMYDLWKDGKRIKKGAIGALKDALGAHDPEMLKKLRNEGNIPPVLNLPLEIDGIKLDPNGDPKEVTVSGNGKTTLKEAGEKKMNRSVEVIKVGDIYVAYDKAKPAEKFTGDNEAAAVAQVKAKNPEVKYDEELERKNYTVDKK